MNFYYIRLLFIFSSIYFSLSILYNEMDGYYVVILSLFGTSMYNFIHQLGQKVTILDFIGFSGITFWLTVPVCIRLLGYDSYIPGYEVLAVEESVYFDYAIPATVAMNVGLLLPISRYSGKEREIFKAIKSQLSEYRSKNVVNALLVFGLVGIVLGPFAPSSLGFVSFLVSQVFYVSIFYASLSIYTNKYITGLIIATFTVSSIIAEGMFGAIVWWSLAALMIFAVQYKLKLWTKLVAFSVGIYFLLFIQLFKVEFRDLTWFQADQSQDKTEAFLGVTQNLFNNPELIYSDQSIFQLLYRVNQAQLSSMVLRHVPEREPYANGETIFNAILASLVPRILWNDKVKSGGRENMSRFAGYELQGNTSMDIAQIGDAYANFGRIGGIIFLFLYGLFNNYLYHGIVKYAFLKRPTFLLWSPFIFIQLLKVEVGVDTMFNAAVKGTIFVIICFYLFRNFFRISI